MGTEGRLPTRRSERGGLKWLLSIIATAPGPKAESTTAEQEDGSEDDDPEYDPHEAEVDYDDYLDWLRERGLPLPGLPEDGPEDDDAAPADPSRPPDRRH